MLEKVRKGYKNLPEGAYEECTFTYDGYGRRMQKSYLTGYNYPAEDAAYNSSTTNTVDYTYDNSGRLIRELRTNVIQYGTTTTTTRELIYLYDESGMIGVMHNSQPYYYHRNLQGDVIAIYDANGEKQVEYAYDAWGNCTTVYGENDELAYLNPIRYRGYYYDTETGLYYLNARYYSPEWRRFISPDNAEYIDPETPNGLSLYCYCANNPIMNVDPSGYAWYNVLWDWGNTIAGLLNPISKLTALGSIAIAAIDGRWDDFVDDWNNGCLNPFNQDENTALRAKVLGFYKGSTVVTQNIFGTCSIFGTIWAESNISSTILKHEYGHFVQERILGSAYLFTVAVPSVVYCWYDFRTNGSARDYFSMPWERTADWLGGVNRGNYKTGSLAWGIAENLLGPIVIPLYLLFCF